MLTLNSFVQFWIFIFIDHGGRYEQNHKLISAVTTWVPANVELCLASPFQKVLMSGFLLDIGVVFPILCACGIFCLRLIFGENYPEKPPRVRFTSDVFHPNGKC